MFPNIKCEILPNRIEKKSCEGIILFFYINIDHLRNTYNYNIAIAEMFKNIFNYQNKDLIDYRYYHIVYCSNLQFFLHYVWCLRSWIPLILLPLNILSIHRQVLKFGYDANANIILSFRVIFDILSTWLQ